jgi:(S)-ureidoglycine aminohydrolase
MQTSRGVRGASYTVVTPANHYPSRLPAFGDAPVVKLVTPRLAPSRIGEYLVTLAPGAVAGVPDEPGLEAFFYALVGDATLGGLPVAAGGFAYLPLASTFDVHAGDAGVRLLIVKRRYQPYTGLSRPTSLVGHRDDEPFADTEVPGFRRRELLPPADPAFDFNMSLLAFDAGVGLGKVEIHDEEHGLYMTAGGGTYLLEDAEHEVQAGDFIYMAPYCPQGFEAGPKGAEYLLYKDVWRDGF